MTGLALRRRERGETLVELLVTISILGIAVIAIVGGLGDAILASTAHRGHSTADTAARSVAECIKDRNQTYQANGVYGACPAPSGTTVSITPAWWNGDAPATFNGTQNARGLQQLTITANAAASTETVVILKRRT